MKPVHEGYSKIETVCLVEESGRYVKIEAMGVGGRNVQFLAADCEAHCRVKKDYDRPRLNLL